MSTHCFSCAFDSIVLSVLFVIRFQKQFETNDFDLFDKTEKDKEIVFQPKKKICPKVCIEWNFFVFVYVSKSKLWRKSILFHRKSSVGWLVGWFLSHHTITIIVPKILSIDLCRLQFFSVSYLPIRFLVSVI